MAGAFLGVTEADAVINVGVSGPGVVKKGTWEKVRGKGFEETLRDNQRRPHSKSREWGSLWQEKLLQDWESRLALWIFPLHQLRQ